MKRQTKNDLRERLKISHVVKSLVVDVGFIFEIGVGNVGVKKSCVRFSPRYAVCENLQCLFFSKRDFFFRILVFSNIRSWFLY